MYPDVRIAFRDFASQLLCFLRTFLSSSSSASILLMLLRPRGIAEVCWIGAGALLLVATAAVPLRLAGQRDRRGTDVYLFLDRHDAAVGTGAAISVCSAGWPMSPTARERVGRSALHAHLSRRNAGHDVHVQRCHRGGADAGGADGGAQSKPSRLPHLFACALIANAASFVLPISNPANLVVFRTHMPPLGHWLASFALPSLLSILPPTWCCAGIFAANCARGCRVDRERTHLTGNGRLVLAGIILVALVLMAASAMNIDLGLPTCIWRWRSPASSPSRRAAIR